MKDRDGRDAWRERLARDLLAMLGFYARIPVRPAAEFRFADAAWAAPLAGLVIGAGAALVLVAALALGLPPFVAATLAVAALIASSGGLHEDGLADVADGFGGGRTRERKLAIMRDSRLGTYGALALIVSALLRVGALAELTGGGPPAAGAALVAAAAVSRTASLWPLHSLPPARADGLGFMAGRPAGRAMLAAVLLSVVPALLAALFVGLAATCTGLALAALAAAAVTALARRQIGGATGDVAGAAQQAAEIAFLLGLLMFPP